MSLQELHKRHNAKLADDGIPLHYGDLLKEYQAAINQSVILDRSHEGRIQIFGKDRFEFLNRMSTNKMVNMAEGEGRPTIFTSPTARVIDRIIAYNRDDHLLVITEPGQGATITQFLQKQIFFNDDVRLVNITAHTNQFALHGKTATDALAELNPDAKDTKPLHSLSISIGSATIFAAKRKSICHDHWVIVTPQNQAEVVYEAILETGKNHGLIPAGSLTYNTLRIRAGRPARPELNNEYIPLELGLWDEVSFAKGCYTGQEIIARMESRGKLAKTLVALDMTEFVPAPAEIIKQDGKPIGKLTSSVQAPDGDIFAMAVIKTQSIEIGTQVTVGENIQAKVKSLLGEQPDYIT